MESASVALEIIALNLADGADIAALKAADADMEKTLISQQKGFLWRVTAVGKDEVTQAKQYYIQVYWQTMADALNAATVVNADPKGKVLFPFAKNPDGIDHYGHYEIGAGPELRKNAGIMYPGLTDPKVTDPNVALEIIALNLADGADVTALRAADLSMEKDLISKQPGFLKRITAVGKSELTQAPQYSITVYWKTLDDALNAATVVNADPKGKVLFPFAKSPDALGHYGHYVLGATM
jgi:heme-degrading monooxygenase HmoA